MPLTVGKALSEPIASVTLETFRPLVGCSFVVSEVAEQNVIAELQLVDASGLENGQPGHRQPFSLIFEGPAIVPLEQNTYGFRHSAFAHELPLFIVPISERDGIRAYQAIFG